MAFWGNLQASLVGGAGLRQPGIQVSSPGYYSESASPVTINSALQLSAVWACVKLIAEALSTMPINFYKINSNGVKTPYPDHPLARLFATKPNKLQTKQEYFETIAFQLVMLGNDYSLISRNGQGDIVSLYPLMTQQMEVDLTLSGDVVYKYQSGTSYNQYNDSTVWHNRLFGNGIVGLSPLAYARNSIAIGQSAEASVTNIYKNGGKPSGLLTIDQVIKPEQRDQIKKNFDSLTNGTESRLFVLEAGMKFQQVSLSPQDIELLASRKFQIEDICRFYGVPSVLVNDTSATTAWGSGIQQIVSGFYKLGLRPYIERYESSINNRLLKVEERGAVCCEFDYESLLKLDYSERVKAQKEAVTGGLKTPNECRAMEGDAPKPGGDSLYMQQQMTPLDVLEKLDRTKTPTPSPPAAKIEKY